MSRKHCRIFIDTFASSSAYSSTLRSGVASTVHVDTGGGVARATLVRGIIHLLAIRRVYLRGSMRDFSYTLHRQSSASATKGITRYLSPCIGSWDRNFCFCVARSLTAPPPSQTRFEGQKVSVSAPCRDGELPPEPSPSTPPPSPSPLLTPMMRRE